MSDWRQPTYDELGRIADSRKVIIEANKMEITRLRTLISEADQRERDSRRMALEEAAKVADKAAEKTPWEQRKRLAKRIATSIRKLQSEER